MELQIIEEYEALAIEWQYQFICLLKKSLDKFGVEANLAKEIVGEFAFDFAMLHDQGEISVNGQQFNPKIAFDNLADKLICSDEESNLHD